MTDFSRLYRAFPDYGEPDFILPDGFVDTSEKGKACPTFYQEEGGLMIVAEHKDAAKRKSANPKRFALVYTSDKVVPQVIVDAEMFEGILEAIKWIYALTNEMRQEIKDNIKSNLFLLDDVSCYSDLHDFVDANCYGGICNDVDTHTIRQLKLNINPNMDEDSFFGEAFTGAINAAQSTIDAWLKAKASQRSEREAEDDPSHFDTEFYQMCQEGRLASLGTERALNALLENRSKNKLTDAELERILYDIDHTRETLTKVESRIQAAIGDEQ